MIVCRSQSEIAKLRRVNQLVGRILAELKRAEYDLIIMGVSRRPGAKLFFGDTAAAVFEDAAVSLVLVAS